MSFSTEYARMTHNSCEVNVRLLAQNFSLKESYELSRTLFSDKEVETQTENRK